MAHWHGELQVCGAAAIVVAKGKLFLCADMHTNTPTHTFNPSFAFVHVSSHLISWKGELDSAQCLSGQFLL